MTSDITPIEQATSSPLILHETESTRFVRISSDYRNDFHDGSQIVQTQARFHEDGTATLYRMSSSDKPQCFELNEAETDAFVSASLAWKAHQAAKKASEQERVQALFEHANQLAVEHGMTIYQTEDDWNILTKNGEVERVWRGQPEQLLERVQELAARRATQQ